MSPMMMYITYKNVLVLKVNFEFLLDSKPSDISLTSCDMFEFSKHRMCLGVQNVVNFFSTSSYDIMSA
jgi:hypothetical protein